jgi:hypothetical protein
MANHVRKQVRDAVKARLTGLATTGSRVYVNRVDPMAEAVTSELSIRGGPESIERQSLGQPNAYVRRAQTIVVTARARASAAVEDTLDQIAKEVEVALLAEQADLTLDGLVLDSTLVAIDEPRISGEGTDLVGELDMQFQVLLNAREGIPDAVI